jgi:hypothetical protein
MKKLFFCFSLALISSFFSAEESEITKAFTHFDLGVSTNCKSFMPSLSLGERFDMRYQAFDLTLGVGFKKHYFYFYTPKLMYLYYFDDTSANSCFLGGGLSWLYLKKKTPAFQKFNGLGTHLALGFEMSRHSQLREILQINLSQPTVAASRSGDFPLPIIELAFGLGF